MLLLTLFIPALTAVVQLSRAQPCQVPRVSNALMYSSGLVRSPGERLAVNLTLWVVCIPGHHLNINNSLRGTRLSAKCQPGGNWSVPSFGHCSKLDLRPLAARSATPPSQDDLAVCGVTNFNPFGRVVGGQIGLIDHFPWMVKLLIAFEGRLVPSLCGGSILSSKWILTAAHCFDSDRKVLNITMYFGRTSFTTTGYEPNPVEEDTRYSTNYISHPSYVSTYESSTQHYDFTLIKIEPPLRLKPTIRPICLPDESGICDPIPDFSSNVTDKCSLTASAGWGLTEALGGMESTSKDLKYIMLNIYSQERCEEISMMTQGYERNITDVQICAGRSEGGQDTCSGDSGGPLMCFPALGHGKAHIVGLVSYGDVCGMADNPAVYARVCRVNLWIRDVTGIPRHGNYSTYTPDSPSLARSAVPVSEEASSEEAPQQKPPNSCDMLVVENGQLQQRRATAATGGPPRAFAGFGDVVTLTCDMGYEFEPSPANVLRKALTICFGDDTWFPPELGSCARPDGAADAEPTECVEPPEDSLGNHEQFAQDISGQTQFAIATRLNVTCQDGYELVGSTSQLYCLPNLSWLRLGTSSCVADNSDGCATRLSELPQSDEALGVWPLDSKARLRDISLHGNSLTSPRLYSSKINRPTGPFGRQFGSYTVTSVNSLIGGLDKKLGAATSFTFAFHIKVRRRGPATRTVPIAVVYTEDNSTRSHVFSMTWLYSGAHNNTLEIRTSRVRRLANIIELRTWNYVAVVFDHTQNQLLVYKLQPNNNAMRRLYYLPRASDIQGWPSDSTFYIGRGVNYDDLSCCRDGLTENESLSCFSIYKTPLTPSEIVSVRQACDCGLESDRRRR